MTFAQPQNTHTHSRPFASRSRNSLLSRAPSSTTLAANAFITGVDGKDLWLSPPDERDDHNSASAAPYDAPASTFSLLAPAETPGLDADYASSQLFPSIDSWISAHLTNSPGKQQQSQPSLSLPLPTHSSSSQSPPLWSPSSASTSSSEAAAAAAATAPASSTAPPPRQQAQRRQSTNNRQSALPQTSTSLVNTLQHPAIPVASTSTSVSPPVPPSRPRRRSSSRIRNLGGSTGPISLTLPVMNDNAQTFSSSTTSSSAPTAPHPASDANNITQPALVSTASGGQFRVSARHAMKEACSYDLRQHQEPPTVDIEYPNTGKNAADSQDVKEIKGLERTLEKTPGPVCFPRTSTTPAPPGSPSRVANSQDVKVNVGSSPNPYNNKPTSGSKAPGSSNAFLQQIHMQNQSPRLQQQASPRTAGNPQLGAAHDIQVPAGNLPQMPAPQQQQSQHQQQQGGFNAHPQPPPNPAQRQFDHTDAQLLAALGGQGKMQQGSPQQPQRPHQGQMPGSPARAQAAHQQFQNALSPQQQAAQRQQNLQGYGMLPPHQQQQQGAPGAPGANGGGGGSTDIQVPQANPMQNAGTPSQGQSSLPPLPNYQSAPAPLNFADGSFFSHQAILASLQAEENAKAAAAAAAVMGFQNGNWAPPSNGSAGQQQGQQGGAPNGQQQQQQQFNSFQAQPGQQPVPGQQQLPGFSQPGTSNALGDFSFEQHFGAPQTAGNSPDAATASSRKRGKGKRGQNYGGAFNFGGFGNNNGNNNIPVSGGGDLDAEGEDDDDDSKPQFNSRGVAKRKSASTARELAQAQQQDHVEEYEYQGFVPKGSGGGANAMPPSANAGPGGGGGGYNEDSDSEDDEGDEWVAEESDDSYGKKKRPNKRARKSSGKGLTQAEADALRSASPTTAAAALASVNADGNFDFSTLADFAASPDISGASAGGKKRKNNAAPPGSGQIVCNHVDPKTGEVCLVRFRRPYDQARHMETVHSDQAEKTKWACITCKKSFSRKDALIRHGRISNHATM